MTGLPRLRWVPGAPVAQSGDEVVGLEGLLARHLRRARWAGMPGAAVDGGRGIRWPRREQRDRSWWPQGIDVRKTAEGLMLAVSWHHPVEGVDTESRVTFVDLRGGRPRFAHVQLVQLVDGVSRPVAVHAGGLAWYGDLLHVADTFGGLRVFDVRDIVVRRAPWWRSEYLLVQSGDYAAENPHGQRRMRYSFISLEHDPAGPLLVAGEYRTASEEDARLVRLPLGDHAPDRVDLHAPGIARMQGVCVVDGTWYITTSNGQRRGGDLLVGHPDALVRHEGVLPPGPEDLAHEPGSSRLWSVTEHPGKRWIYVVDAAGISPAGSRA